MRIGWLLFSFSGRLNRKPFWMAYVGTLAIGYVVSRLIEAGYRGNPIGNALLLWTVFTVAVVAVQLWLALAPAAKRLHDRNRSAWWVPIYQLLPPLLLGIGHRIPPHNLMIIAADAPALLIWLWALVDLGFLRGTPGSNRFGDDPILRPNSGSGSTQGPNHEAPGA